MRANRLFDASGPMLTVRIVLLVVLGSCFVAQVWNQVIMFFKNYVTVATSTVQPDQISLPVITLCQVNAFKYDVMAKLGLNMNQWIYDKVSEDEFTAADSRATLEKWWNMTTREASELVIRAEVQTTDALKKKYGESKIQILETRSLYMGRCYTVWLETPIRNKAQALKLTLNASAGTIQAFVHLALSERSNFVGNFWVAQPLEVSVPGDSVISLAVKQVKQLRQESSGTCQEETDAEIMHTCLWKMVGERCIQCYFPALASLPGSVPAAVPPCKNVSAMQAVMTCAYDTVRAGREGACPPPCQVAQFDLASRPLLLGGKPTGISTVYAYYNELEIEEYVLMDFNAIVAAVGGSLGLFLGFSFLDFGVAVADAVRNACTACRSKKKAKRIASSAEK